MHAKTAQKVGVSGVLLIVVGAIFTVLLSQMGVTFGGACYQLGLSLFGVGGALFFIGVVWAWVAGLADAMRAWDSIRRPLFCPLCGQRYSEDQGHTCPKDGTELRPAT